MAMDRTSNANPTPSKGGDPKDNGNVNRGKGKPANRPSNGESCPRAKIGNSNHGRWK